MVFREQYGVKSFFPLGIKKQYYFGMLMGWNRERNHGIEKEKLVIQ